MKHFLFALMFGFVYLASAKAQDARYVGTWKWHFDSPYDNEIEGPHSRDEFIRIDIEDNQVFIRLKLESKNDKNLPFVTRREGENVIVHDDGKISFDEYLGKNEYDQDDNLYWTVWQHYVVNYEGGRLNVIRKLMGEGRNKDGALIKDDKNNPRHIWHKTYYNEKDNW